MRSARVFAFVAVALACAGTPPRAAAPPIGFDDAWLDDLDVPATRGKALVALFDAGQEATPGVELARDASSLTLFDGLVVETHALGRTAPDAPDPPHAEPLSTADLPKAVAAPRDAADLLRALVFARIARERGDSATSEALLHTVGENATMIGARAARARGSWLLQSAVTRHAADGSPARLRSDLARAARHAGSGAVYAREVLAAMDASGSDAAASTPLDDLVRTRVDALVDDRCVTDPPDGSWPSAAPAGRVRTLGFTALEALAQRTRDPRPTRCVLASDATGDEAHPRLGTVGASAARIVAKVLGPRAFDPTDVECGREGHDAESLALVESALARSDITDAVGIARRARGRLRVAMVARIADTAGAGAVEFLDEEASRGPVHLARIEAARARGARGNTTWTDTMVPIVVDALANGDASGAATRCDSAELSHQGVQLLLRFAPTALISEVSHRFDKLGPRARIQLEVDLHMLAPKRASDARARDALLGRALEDERSVAGAAVAIGTSKCANASPADVAALSLGPRVGIPYSCSEPPERKKLARDEIRARTRGHR